jgi:DNA-binding XRE family transcriptional regulator
MAGRGAIPTLKEAREACGLTQSELGNLAGVRTEDVIAWEADAAGATIDGLYPVAIILGVAPEHLRQTVAKSTTLTHNGSSVTSCVVVAHEWRLWNSAMAVAFRTIRPHLDVVDATPNDLDAAVVRYAPALVVCGELTGVVKSCVPAWVQIDPVDANRATVGLGGRERVIAPLDFVDLIAVLDEATRSNGAH